MEGDAALPAAPLAHPGGGHRFIEAVAQVGGVVGVARVRVAEHEVVVGPVGRALEVALKLRRDPVGHRHGSA